MSGLGHSDRGHPVSARNNTCLHRQSVKKAALKYVFITVLLDHYSDKCGQPTTRGQYILQPALADVGVEPIHYSVPQPYMVNPNVIEHLSGKATPGISASLLTSLTAVQLAGRVSRLYPVSLIVPKPHTCVCTPSYIAYLQYGDL